MAGESAQKPLEDVRAGIASLQQQLAQTQSPQASELAATLQKVLGRLFAAGEEVQRLQTQNRQLEEQVANRSEHLDEVRRTLSHEQQTHTAMLVHLVHELVLPLRPVLASVLGIENEPQLPAELRLPLSLLRRRLEMEIQLADDIAQLVRDRVIKPVLRPEVVDLRQVLHEAAGMCCRQEVDSGRLRVESQLRARDHQVWADRARLTQVFWNLLDQIVREAPGGTVVTVRTQTHERTGEANGARQSWLRIEVLGASHAIEAALASADQGLQPDSRLGLLISRRIIELHGGRMLASVDAAAAAPTLVIELPAYVPQASKPKAAPVEPAGERPVQADRRLHILLVEDHREVAQIIAGLLEKLGYHVTAAGSITEALEAAQRFHGSDEIRQATGGIDLVISDLRLPDGSGWHLMRQLTNRFKLKGIALSGYGTEAFVRQSREAGFLRHLTKPVDAKTLDAAVRETKAASK